MKRGRPPLTVKRSARLQLRLYPEEMEALRDKATAAELSIVDFIRRACELVEATENDPGDDPAFNPFRCVAERYAGGLSEP